MSAQIYVITVTRTSCGTEFFNSKATEGDEVTRTLAHAASELATMIYTEDGQCADDYVLRISAI